MSNVVWYYYHDLNQAFIAADQRVETSGGYLVLTKHSNAYVISFENRVIEIHTVCR